MRKIVLLFITVLSLSVASAQDFSNKGKEFWLCFPAHVPSGSNLAQFTIWITSDLASSGTVALSDGSFSTTFNVAANGITPIAIPYANAHISNGESGVIGRKSIRVAVNAGMPPVVAYAQQYGAARSASTLLLPTNVLGKKYFATSFTQLGTGVAKSQFQIIATKPGTNVTITPRFNGVLQVPFTVSFPNVGDIYQYQADQDITGSVIESIASGSGGCNPIAVFSGSSALTMNISGCTGGQNSYDPLFQQAYPVTSWGKNFGFIPFGDYPNGNPYRIMASEDNTTITINGAAVATINAGQIYPTTFVSNPIVLTQPSSIVANRPILVAQYAQKRDCSGSGHGDPDMVILNPIEQNISNITIFTSTQENIDRQWLNVLVKTAGAASFRINGVAPTTPFVAAPNIPGFSYLTHRFLTPVSGSKLLACDSGFNAIAYGFQGGQFESYAYSAGTNVRDLTQQLELETTYGIETSPSVCTNSPFVFKVYFPDSTLSATPVEIRYDSLRWRLTSGTTIMPNNFPVFVPGTVGAPPVVAIDSTNIRNGRQVNWYSLPTTYSYTTAGRDTLIITAYRSTNEGCGTSLEYEFPIQISDPPTASFTSPAPGCYLAPVVVTETTPQLPKTTYRQWWEFFDPVTNTTTVYTNAPPNPSAPLRTVSHTFTTPGVKQIRHSSITTPGCLSDTIVQFVTLPDLPDATIAGNITACINTGTVPVTFTGTLGTAEYYFHYNINGGATQTTPFPSVGGVTTINAPTTVAGPFIYNLVGVTNALPVGTPCTRTVAGQSITVNITPDATVTLSSAAGTDNQTVCINNPITNITYAIGGSGNGGSVSGLPAGVTGSYAGGVVTITGTPTAAGVFPYTVNTTGPCLTPFTTGTINVTADATIALTSAAGSDNQTLCINTPLLTNITYAVGGSGTGGTVTGLPAGITGVYAGGTVTISGTPTAAGVFNYTVNTVGPCIIPTATGTITVTGDGTLTLTSAAGTNNQSICINIPITNITYAVGGTGTGGSVAGLPPGVTGVFAGGVITIAGTPTVVGVYGYTVSTTGPCVIPTATGTITVNPDASIVLTSAAPTTSQELCRNSTLTNITYAISGGGTGAGVVGLPAGVTGVYAGGVFTISGTPTVAGTFNYTVTTTGTCVQNSLAGSILVNQLPTAGYTYTAPSCETRTIDFTDVSVPNSGALTNWNWNFGDPGSGPLNTSTVQNPSHTFATAGSYTVTLSVTTDKGCISNPIASIPVIIDYRPEAGFIIPEVCLSDTYAQFLDTSKITAGTITGWNWNFGDPGSGPLNTSTLQNPTHSYSAVGPYDVELIVTSANGCKDTILQQLFVNGSFPQAIFNVNNASNLCANDSVAVVEGSTVFPGVITKIEIWFDDAVAGPPGPPNIIDNSPFTGKVYRHLYPNFQAPLTRVFRIRYRAYSGGVCLDDSLRNITVNAAPLVQFNNMPNSCLLVPPFQITQASEIGGVPGSGVYSGPGVSPTGIFTPGVAGVGTHTILYTYTSTAAGCVDTMSNTITVIDTAHAAFSYVLPSCEQVPISFTDLSTAPAGVVLANTVWDFGDGTPVENHPPGSTFGHTFALPGTYTVTMHNVSAFGCLSTDTSAVITIDANHSITLNSANNNQTVCINNAIVDIIYTLGGGATDATVTGLPTGVTSSVAGNILTISGIPSPLAGGPAFPYSISTTGNTCVVATATGVITVGPDHTIAFSSGDTMQSVCVNTPIDPIVYTLGGGASGATISGLPAGVTYSVSGNTLTISGTPTAAGGPSYPYMITTTGNSCLKANADGEILVNPYPVPGFAPDKPGYCIPNAIVKFNNSSSMPDGSGMTYSWNFADGSPLSTAVSPTHWYTTQGPFNVVLTVTSVAVLNGGLIGCAKSITIPLTTIHPQPKADFVFNKPSVCIGDNVIITDNTDGKDGIVNQWNWQMGDGATRVTNPVTYTYADTISYDITMYSINTHGCNSDTITKMYTVYPYPHVNAGPDRFVLEGGQIQLETITFANDAQYNWTPSLYLTDSKIARPWVIKPLTDMTYRLTVTARGGCALSDDVYVKLLRFPVIPNTFTPNNDGINDTWRIDFLNTYPDNRVQIFTRGGNLVFQSRGYNTPWDGTVKGKPLPFDTYYYIIEPGSGRDPITGYVTILK